MGQTEVVDEEAFADEEVSAEWQAGVLRAERPALRATWRRGRGGSEYKVWCVERKISARWDQREDE
jgi:hypothetical protein